METPHAVESELCHRLLYGREPMVAVARMVKGHLEGALNHSPHGITNAVAEGLNLMNATTQKMAHRYRNKSYFRTAVLFRCGGPSLYPRTPDNTG